VELNLPAFQPQTSTDELRLTCDVLNYRQRAEGKREGSKPEGLLHASPSIASRLGTRPYLSQPELML
jgi:hypothetical protein